MQECWHFWTAFKGSPIKYVSGVQRIQSISCATCFMLAAIVKRVRWRDGFIVMIIQNNKCACMVLLHVECRFAWCVKVTTACFMSEWALNPGPLVPAFPSNHMSCELPPPPRLPLQVQSRSAFLKEFPGWVTLSLSVLKQSYLLSRWKELTWISTDSLSCQHACLQLVSLTMTKRWGPDPAILPARLLLLVASRRGGRNHVEYCNSGGPSKGDKHPILAILPKYLLLSASPGTCWKCRSLRICVSTGKSTRLGVYDTRNTC